MTGISLRNGGSEGSAAARRGHLKCGVTREWRDGCSKNKTFWILYANYTNWICALRGYELVESCLQMMHVTRKQTLRSLSLPYQKRDLWQSGNLAISGTSSDQRTHREQGMNYTVWRSSPHTPVSRAWTILYGDRPHTLLWAGHELYWGLSRQHSAFNKLPCIVYAILAKCPEKYWKENNWSHYTFIAMSSIH